MILPGPGENNKTRKKIKAASAEICDSGSFPARLPVAKNCLKLRARLLIIGPRVWRRLGFGVMTMMGGAKHPESTDYPFLVPAFILHSFASGSGRGRVSSQVSSDQRHLLHHKK
ncbi:MAG TPA: hypothetical protein DCR87_07550 [Acidobacteria bacterium]|nr:hypothetical protein [Acidobacteriota bacterium]